MARAKSPTRKKHKKILKQAKGYRDARRKRFKVGKEAVLHAGQYAYVGRRKRKRDLRRLWIVRLNAAAREYDLSYSQFVNGLKKAKINIDRKILADIAVSDENAFKQIIERAKKTL